MHFRERNRRFQVIRTVYEPERKKGKSVIVGSISKEGFEIDDKLRQNCSAEEMLEVEAWIARSKANPLDPKLESVRLLVPSLENAIRVFRREPPSEQSRQLAGELGRALVKLRQIMRKSGHLDGGAAEAANGLD